MKGISQLRGGRRDANRDENTGRMVTTAVDERMTASVLVFLNLIHSI